MTKKDLGLIIILVILLFGVWMYLEAEQKVQIKGATSGQAAVKGGYSSTQSNYCDTAIRLKCKWVITKKTHLPFVREIVKYSKKKPTYEQINGAWFAVFINSDGQQDRLKLPVEIWECK